MEEDVWGLGMGKGREDTYEFSGFAEVVAFRAPLGFAAMGFECIFREEDKRGC